MILIRTNVLYKYKLIFHIKATNYIRVFYLKIKNFLENGAKYIVRIK